MLPKDIDKSTVYIKIIFSLIDGRDKKLEEIAFEYGDTEKQYKTACSNLLKAHILKLKEGAYSINFDTFKNHVKKNVTVEELKSIINSKPIRKSIRDLKKEISTGYYKIILLIISTEAQIYLANKAVDRLQNKNLL